MEVTVQELTEVAEALLWYLSPARGKHCIVEIAGKNGESEFFIVPKPVSGRFVRGEAKVIKHPAAVGELVASQLMKTKEYGTNGRVKKIHLLTPEGERRAAEAFNN